MTRALKLMPSPQGVAGGQTTSITLPLGLTYNALYIEVNWDVAAVATDVAVSDWGSVVEEIRLMVNGDARITIDAADLVKLNQFYGQPMTAGVLPLFLSRPWMRTIGGEDQTAYGTVGIDTFSIEIDIKSGAVVNSLRVYASQSAATAFGPHLRIQKYIRPQSVTGPAEIAEITRGNYAMLALHVSTSAVGQVEIYTDQRKVIESSPTIRAAHASASKRVPQAGFTHVDFLAENRLVEALPMNVQDFRLKLDFQATGNFAIYAESIVGGVF